MELTPHGANHPKPKGPTVCVKNHSSTISNFLMVSVSMIVIGFPEGRWMLVTMLDLYRTHRSEYSQPKTPRLVRVKPAEYLTIVGWGEPGGKEFTAALAALYGVAYTIRMAQQHLGRDYKICKLEGIWWGDDEDDSGAPPTESNWKLLIRVPDFVGAEHVNEAKATLREKGRDPEVREVGLEDLAEGTCVQMLHVGPHARGAETLASMRQFAREHGFEFHGKRHEIYVSDPSRVTEEKLKTILRVPVNRAPPLPTPHSPLPGGGSGD